MLKAIIHILSFTFLIKHKTYHFKGNKFMKFHLNSSNLVVARHEVILAQKIEPTLLGLCSQ